MSASILLPGRSRQLLVEKPAWRARHQPPRTRRVIAAAHVAADSAGAIDWDTTLAFRDYLWDHGFGVAEAMDTSQRGGGLTWPLASELIARSCVRARMRQAEIGCGAGTDHLDPAERHSIGTIIGAYEQQIGVVQVAGGQVIVMASRALAAAATASKDYLDVYGAVLAGVERPAILHWLGEPFDPALAGYWGSVDFDTASATVLELIDRAGDKIDGIKVSVLNAAHEIELRKRLPEHIRLYTGDDFNFAELIRGDGSAHSDALLGVFAAIAAPAAEALHYLDVNEMARFDSIIEPTIPLARKLFEAPTSSYKAGIAFLAWLNGQQAEFVMLDGFESQRSLAHLVEVFELAATAGALLEPDLAVERMTYLIARLTS